MAEKRKSPYRKDQVVIIDYGGSIAVYLFRDYTKNEVAAYWAKKGLGEAAQNIEFRELHKTDPDVFLVYSHHDGE